MNKKTIFKFLLTLTLLLTSGFVWPGNIVVFAQAAGPDFDDAQNLAETGNRAKESVESTTRTANSIYERYVKEVLDAVAINAAQIAGQKLSNATYQWIAGGFKGGNQLFVNAFDQFIAEAPNAALRQGLSELTKAITASSYDAGAKGQREFFGTAYETPVWIQNYLASAYNRNPQTDATAFDDFVTGVYFKEITDYCDGYEPDGSCASTANPNRPTTICQPGISQERCTMSDTQWEFTFTLINSEALTFQTTGWDTGNPENARPIGQSVLNANDGTGKPVRAETLPGKDVNAFATRLAQNTVREYGSTLAGTVETTLESILGEQWLNYGKDATIGFDPLDPYGGWDALLLPGNNAIGTAFTVANRVALSADRRLKAALTEATSGGILPEKTCEREGQQLFRDGTAQSICKAFTTNSPSAAVGETLAGAITKSFAVTGEVDTWQKLGGELLAEAASAVIRGGIQAAAGEIRNRSQEVVAQVTQLGPFSYLYGKVADNLTTGDDQAWQLLGNRDIDFSLINKQINATSRQANALRQAGEVFQAAGAPLLVLDQECVLGPDFGWEQRLRSNFRNDTRALFEEVNQNINSNTDKRRAQRQFMKDLEEELDRQVSLVNEAMPDSPFALQFEFSTIVDAAIKEVGQGSQILEEASQKQNAVSTMIRVRELIEDLGPEASILTKQPPTWEDDPELVFGSGVNDLGNLEISEDRLTKDELKDFGSTESGSTSNAFSKPRIIVSGTNITVPHQEDDYAFNIMQNIAVVDAEDSQNATLQADLNSQLVDNITVTRIVPGNPALNTPATLTTIPNQPGVFINISESYTAPAVPEVVAQPAQYAGNGALISEQIPGSPGQPEMEKGYQYRITYSVTDSDGNTSTANRVLHVQTYEQHLSELTDFNRKLQAFIASVPSADNTFKLKLSRIINLYLSIEEDIGSDAGVRNAEAELQRAEQLFADLYDNLDRCYVALWKLDKLIPENLMPGNHLTINNLPFDFDTPSGKIQVTPNINSLTTSNNPGWSALQDILEDNIRIDSRVPYVMRAIEREGRPEPANTDGAPSRDILQTATNISSFGGDSVTGYLWDTVGSFSNNNEALRIVQFFARPNIVEFATPDFQCSLDTDILEKLKQNGYTNAQIRTLLIDYQNHFCISKLNTDAVFQTNRDIRRIDNTNSNSDSKLSNAYSLGRYGIGQFDWYLDQPEGIFPQSQSVSENNILFRNPQGCNNSYPSFRRDVLGSTINCNHFGGTLVHSSPAYPDEAVLEGLAVDYDPYAIFHPYVLTNPGANENTNANVSPNLARRNNYTYPYTAEVSFDDPPYIYGEPEKRSVKMFSVDVYREHTERRLYCRHRSILFQPLKNFNSLFDIDNNGGGGVDRWWTGDLRNDGTPETNDIGNAGNLWTDVQRCADWTLSDLSTYLDYPKQESTL